MSFLSGLSGAQKSAVLHEEGPAAVFAGPGSGKTRVVTLRAARLAHEGNSILVTTFTSDATEEMRTRLKEILPSTALELTHVTTLHALCLAILKKEAKKFELLTDEYQRRNFAESAKASNLERGVRGFLTEVSYRKNTGMSADRYKHDGSTEDIEFAKVWRAYEKIKQEKGLREFDDLLLDALDLLENDLESRNRVASRYQYIIVDECQDMNTPQFAIAFLLGLKHKNLMLVGDLDQSLYGFRGADVRTFRMFASHNATKVYELTENYRSSRSIMRFADSLIRQDTERRSIDFVPIRKEGQPVVWNRYDDADLEALAVGAKVLELNQAGMKFKDMAVLFRMNAQSEALERHFAALEIPYAIREEGDFYARKEIQGILAYLNFFASLQDPRSEPSSRYPDEWLLALLDTTGRKLRTAGAGLKEYAEMRGRRIWEVMGDYFADDMKTQRGLRYLRQDLEQMEAQILRAKNAGEAVRTIRIVANFDRWLQTGGTDEKDNDRIQNLQQMQAAASHYGTIREYLAAVQKVRDEAARRKSERARKRRDRDEVTFSTGHAAKGLEWQCVFAVGWSENILPHHKSEDIGEERRIAYVIATRAKDLLFVSSLERWNDATVSHSRFLTGINT